jgi:hypothetical protein
MGDRRELGISRCTVQDHLKAICFKTGVRGRRARMPDSVGGGR